MTQSATAAWAAVTTYLPGARVTPVTPNGTNWVSYAGGVSDVTEPAWPSGPPWTVSDGTVTWAIGSSFRQLVSAGLLSVLTAFRDANPTLLKGVHTARPNSYDTVDKPGCFIDGGNEQVTYSEGLRRRHLATTVTVFTFIPDNAEAQNGMDALIDGLLDAFTHAYHAASGQSIVEATSIQQVELNDGRGGSSYLGYQFPFDNYVAEGRN
jgi:hypothetical protein